MFPPAFAPRMGYLCKYLQRAGWEVHVVTEQIEDHTFAFLEGYAASVHYVNFYTACHPLLRKLQWVIVMLLDLLFHYKDSKISKVAADVVRQQNCQAILGCTYRTFPLPAAARLARQFGLPFIADQRDIVEQYAAEEFIAHPLPLPRWINRPIHAYFRRRLLRDRNQALRQAAAVTTVSPWHVQTLSAYNPNTHLIYNGFDPELFYPQVTPAKQFTITYTGRVHSVALQDPTLLFEAIKTLDHTGAIQPADFRLVWYTDARSQSIVEQEAIRFGMTKYMDFKSYVPAAEIPTILNQSSVLLLLTNKSGNGGPNGILTTKFFEYMAVEKPILCVRSDEACLAETIRLTHSGLAATQVEEVCEFLLHYYQEWQAKGYTTSAVDHDQLKQFSRQEQANQFAQLIENCTHHG